MSSNLGYKLTMSRILVFIKTYKLHNRMKLEHTWHSVYYSEIISYNYEQKWIRYSNETTSYNQTIIKKTSLHIINAVSADITSGITSSIASVAGWKPQDFQFVCLSIYVVWPGLLKHPLNSPNLPFFLLKTVGWVNDVDIKTGLATICKYGNKQIKNPVALVSQHK